MKKLLLLIFIFHSLLMAAQKKAPSVALHYGFTDFKTAINIKSSSFGNVLKNGQWSNFPMMDAGYGISYWQGLHKNLDITAGMNFTKSIYTFPAGIYTVSKNLFTFDAKAVFKILSEEKWAVTPYITAGAGLYSNAGKTGFYAPIGLGVHANLWKEAFVFAGADYRITFKNTDNKSFLYTVGLGTHLFRKKVKPAPVPPPAPVVVPEVKPVLKAVAVWVKDEATGLPLPDVEVKLTGADGKTYSGKSDEDGKLKIENVLQANYSVSGILNGIVTQSKQLETAMFAGNDATINLILIHNDPRFTLVGKAVDKKSNKPVGDVNVSSNNITKASVETTHSDAEGKFRIQLAAASDFSISGKKAGYFSNIENVSTKGLNRSTTLYVKLELDIQEAKQGGQFVLNKIYFATNKADLNTTASTDLNRLVKYLQDNATASVEIQGHTDNKGSNMLNQKLSKNRALSVLNYLVAQGINASRLTANGYGSSKPIDTNSTDSGRANNRRVEVKILGE